MHAHNSGRSVSVLWLVAITVAAALLRLRHLDIQILGDDEMHLLVVITSRSLAEIPGTVFVYDYSIPLAMLFSAISDWIPLTELMLRFPVLLCGCCMPVLMFFSARRFVSANVALLAAMAIAVHPLFIYYSRFVRSYAICLVMVIGVLWLLDRWAVERRLRTLAGAAVLSALACWFQALALVTLSLIFLGALLRDVIARRHSRDGGTQTMGRPVALMVAAAATVAMILLLYAPALYEIVNKMILGRVGSGAVDAEALRCNAAVLTGLPGVIPSIVFFALAIAGFVLLARRLGLRSLLLLVPAAGQPLIILLIRPPSLGVSLVLARYQFYVLPLWMLAACAALTAGMVVACNGITCRVPLFARATKAGRACAAVLAAAWILLGPYPTIYTSSNAYAHHYLFQTFKHMEDPFWQSAHTRSPDAPVHPFYKELSASGDDVPVVIEWPPVMDFPKIPYHVAQAYHRRPLKLLARQTIRWWIDRRLALRNVVPIADGVPLDIEPGAVIVLHKNPVVEAAWFGLGRSLQVPPKPRHEKGYGSVYALLSAALGPPAFEDSFLTVFRVSGS